MINNKDFVLGVSRRLALPRWKMIKKHIVGKTLLEVGLGMGTIARMAKDDGYKVTGLDVDNTSLYTDISPVIYDGNNFPFGDNKFDNATIVCVLHHCSNQERVLQEAMRVAKRVIVIEDTFRNKFEHLLVALRDSLENWEFYRHTYRSFGDWKRLCENNGWKVKHVRSWSSMDFGILWGHQTCFVVEK